MVARTCANAYQGAQLSYMTTQNSFDNFRFEWAFILTPRKSSVLRISRLLHGTHAYSSMQREWEWRVGLIDWQLSRDSLKLAKLPSTLLVTQWSVVTHMMTV